jgi:hypothetical protein
MNKLSQLGIDIYRGSTGNFSVGDSEKALREEFLKICGTDKIDRKIMRKHKVEIYEILEEALTEIVGRDMESIFANNAEYRNVSWGDKPTFIIPNPNLFKVAVVADGVGRATRQRLDNGILTVTTKNRIVQIYEEFYRFLAGRIDWVALVNKVARSYTNQIYTEVYNAIYNGYSDLASTYAKTGAFNETTLRTLIEHVETKTGTTATVYGTKNALGMITTAQPSNEEKDTYSKQGYYGGFYGTPMRKIFQSHTNGTDTFAINSSFVMVLPEGDERIVKIVDEGDSIIIDLPGGESADLSQDYVFIRKSGIAVLTSEVWGQYRFV